MFYPHAAELLANVKGDTLLVIKRSPRSLLKLIIGFCTSVIVVASLTMWLSARGYPARWLGIFPALLLAETVRRYYNDLFVLGRDRVVHYKGRISLSYSVPTVRYTDLRAINVDQDIWGRIFDYGNVELGTAGIEGFEMIILGVRSPARLGELLDELRTASIAATQAEASAEGRIVQAFSND